MEGYVDRRLIFDILSWSILLLLTDLVEIPKSVLLLISLLLELEDTLKVLIMYSYSDDTVTTENHSDFIISLYLKSFFLKSPPE